jgi:hypothetical protein
MIEFLRKKMFEFCFSTILFEVFMDILRSKKEVKK